MARNPSTDVRHMARQRACQTLYSLTFTPAVDEDSLWKIFISTPDDQDAPEAEDKGDNLAWQLALGVWRDGDKLDKKLKTHCQNWRFERIGKLELVILRIGLHEILAGKTPPRVAISEALELANDFGVGRAKNFINGILDAAAKSERRNL